MAITSVVYANDLPITSNIDGSEYLLITDNGILSRTESNNVGSRIIATSAVGVVSASAITVTSDGLLELDESTLYINSHITLTADRTTPTTSNIIVGPDGRVTMGAFIWTCYGYLDAHPEQQIFVVTAPAQVIGTLGGVYRHPEWWGGFGDVEANASADWFGIQSAIECSLTTTHDLSATAGSFYGIDIWDTGNAYIKGYRLFYEGSSYQCISGGILLLQMILPELE